MATLSEHMLASESATTSSPWLLRTSEVQALTTIFAVCAVMLYLVVYRWSQKNKVGPKSWPILGASIEQLRNYERLHDWILEYIEKVDTVHVPMPFGYGYTYTANPDNVEYILKSNFSNFPKGQAFHENMEPLLGDGIFNSDGESWRQQRKTARFTFASKVLRDFSTVVFREYAQKLAFILSHFSQKQAPIDMQDIFMRLTLDSICKIGFGVDLGTLTLMLPDVPFARCFDQANYIVSLRFIDPFWKAKRLLNTGHEALLKKSLHVVDNFTYGVIKTRRKEIENARVQGGESARPDILSRFIMLSEEPSSNLNDKSLRDIVLNFVIAGRDTTAVTLSWFTFLLAQHPHVADKIFHELCLFEEQHSASAGAHNTDDLSSLHHHITSFAHLLSYDSVTSLPYLHACICETLRLYPAVPEDPKGVLADDVLPTGLKVKKGCMVTYSPYCMGRMKAIWGEDALAFNPERWLKDNSVQTVSPFKFTTFQAGPRICIGKDSALLQLRITTALLCRFFTFQLVEDCPVRYKTMAILAMAHGLKVLVTTRT